MPLRKGQTNSGSFKKGISGNPSGLPKGGLALRHAARERSLDALNVLIKVMEDEGATNRDRAYAANCVLDRAFGKPRQEVDMVDKTRRAEELSDEQLVQIISGAAQGARDAYDKAKLN